MPRWPSQSIAERFWSKVDRRGPDDCWPWIAYRRRDGYGEFKLPRIRPVKTHRMTWELTYGQRPSLCVLHRCDNPPCCNPGHLFLGSQLDNIADCVAKRRNGAARGEAKWSAKLTENLVREIRNSVETDATIAARLGVSITAVYQARTRRYWKHVV